MAMLLKPQALFGTSVLLLCVVYYSGLQSVWAQTTQPLDGSSTLAHSSSANASSLDEAATFTEPSGLRGTRRLQEDALNSSKVSSSNTANGSAPGISLGFNLETGNLSAVKGVSPKQAGTGILSERASNSSVSLTLNAESTSTKDNADGENNKLAAKNPTAPSDKEAASSSTEEASSPVTPVDGGSAETGAHSASSSASENPGLKVAEEDSSTQKDATDTTSTNSSTDEGMSKQAKDAKTPPSDNTTGTPRNDTAGETAEETAKPEMPSAAAQPVKMPEAALNTSDHASPTTTDAREGSKTDGTRTGEVTKEDDGQSDTSEKSTDQHDLTLTSENRTLTAQEEDTTKDDSHQTLAAHKSLNATQPATDASTEGLGSLHDTMGRNMPQKNDTLHTELEDSLPTAADAPSRSMQNGNKNISGRSIQPRGDNKGTPDTTKSTTVAPSSSSTHGGSSGIKEMKLFWYTVASSLAIYGSLHFM